ncbi:MAG TPA: putative glycoside hydrolase [Gaiellaceae bacterium]|nr:putative glycoside hydrolase [Gaiellaceae bacterium]
MNSASRRLFLVVAALVVLALPGTGGAQSARTAASPESGIGALRICTDCAEIAGDLSRYKYVILNSWDAPMLPALKAQNPGLKALVYKNLSFTVSYECHNGQDQQYLSTGVGYCDADQHHPDWFVTDASGNRLNSAGYPQAWIMDVGNPAYQATWLQSVLADAHAGGWDGVFIDDADADMGWHLDGRTMARYPTAASWRAATRSMLASVGPALTSAGFLAVPNFYTPWSSSYDAEATWRDWLQFVSGGSQEYYSKWGYGSSGWFSGNDWTFRQGFQAATEQAGKIFLGITYAPSGDTRTMTWARANFLLFDNPANQGALVYEFSDPEAQDPYSPVWAEDVGTPSGDRFQVGSAWRRNYSRGTVVVNPTSATVTVQLGGTYYQDDGTAVSSVTLGPTTGAILRSQGPPPPPPPPQAIALAASLSGTSVRLAWTGMSSSSTDVFRNGRRVATVSNSGAYTDRLGRHAHGTYTYRVCVAGTSTCSPDVSVAAGQATASRRAVRSLHAKRLFLLRKLRRTARPA